MQGCDASRGEVPLVPKRCHPSTHKDQPRSARKRKVRGCGDASGGLWHVPDVDLSIAWLLVVAAKILDAPIDQHADNVKAN